MVKNLIDEAARQVGTHAKLAKLLNAPPQSVCDWLADRVPCPPEYIALMANIVGKDPVRWLVLGTLLKNRNNKKNENLVRVFTPLGFKLED